MANRDESIKIVSHDLNDLKAEVKHYSEGSKAPRMDLIFRSALTALASRIELGVDTLGDKAWNAGSQNQECLQDNDWVIRRLGHVIDHATTLIAILRGQELDDGENHAGAILFGGMVAAEVDRVRDRQLVR
jgi:hypothetical protein